MVVTGEQANAETPRTLRNAEEEIRAGWPPFLRQGKHRLCRGEETPRAHMQNRYVGAPGRRRKGKRKTRRARCIVPLRRRKKARSSEQTLAVCYRLFGDGGVGGELGAEAPLQFLAEVGDLHAGHDDEFAREHFAWLVVVGELAGDATVLAILIPAEAAVRDGLRTDELEAAE